MLLGYSRSLPGDNAGRNTLYEAWVKADFTEQNGLVTDIVRALLNIPSRSAGFVKDPDVPSLHYRLCGAVSGSPAVRDKTYKARTLVPMSSSV